MGINRWRVFFQKDAEDDNIGEELVISYTRQGGALFLQ